MSFEPKMEHASRPGIRSAIAMIAVGLGIAAIFYWAQLKVLFGLN